MARPSSLSAPAETLVLDMLRKERQPMTAYGLLDKLKASGIKSPPIIYRALASLVEAGAVHKINELGAFVACDCHDDHSHALSVITVCGKCSKVSELHDHAVIHHLEELSGLGVRLAGGAVIELPVVCKTCA